MPTGLMDVREKRAKTDALSLLKKDHAEVKELFNEMAALSDRAFSSRQKLFEKIAVALRSHTEVEEEIFYPSLKAKVGRGNEQSLEVLEAYEEHAIVKSLLEQIEKIDAKDESYKAKIVVLMEMVEQHIREEESEMFKNARRVFEKNELDDIGERILQMKSGRSGREEIIEEAEE